MKLTERDKKFLIDIAIVPIVAILFWILSFVFGNKSNDNNYQQSKRETKIVHLTDTLRDTIYISVPDRNAYNIGYFDGQFDAYNNDTIFEDRD